VLLEITLNAGSVVWWQQEIARRAARSAWITHGMLAHFMVRLYIAVVCK